MLCSCTVSYEEYRGFKKSYIYESLEDLQFSIRNSKFSKTLVNIRAIDKPDPLYVFPKGEKILITEINTTYPNTSGLKFIYAKVLSGTFKNEMIRVSIVIEVTSFKEIEQKN